MSDGDPSELAHDLREAFASTALAPVSVTVYGSTAAGTADMYSDIDVMCIVETLPPEGVVAELQDLLDETFERPVNVSYHEVAEAAVEAADPASIVSWAVERGIPVAGELLTSLYPNAAAHDPAAAVQRARAASEARVLALRAKDIGSAPRDGLCDLLIQAANTALLHHGLGRFKMSRPKLAVTRLSTLVSEPTAKRVVELCQRLRGDIARAAEEERMEVDGLVEQILARAADDGVPGATKL